MSRITRCDWCGHAFEAREPRAHFNATVWRWNTEGTYNSRGWEEEEEPTLHYCVGERLDLNRLGLTDPRLDDEADSCYVRARGAMSRAQVKPPGVGLEWRLMEVAGAASRAKTAVAGDSKPFSERTAEEQAAWRRNYLEWLPFTNAIPSRAVNAFVSRVISPAAAAAMTDAELLAFNGVGPASLQAIRDNLRSTAHAAPVGVAKEAS